MTKKKMFVAALAVSGLLIGCNKANNPVLPPPTPKPLELLYPKGGESLKVGVTIAVQWLINDTTKISSVEVKLSTNNGITYDFDLGTHSLPPDTLFLPWTITSGQVSTQCRVKINDYLDGSISDQSGTTFTIHN